MGGNKVKPLPPMRFIMTMREELKNYFSFTVTRVRVIGYIKDYPKEGQKYVAHGIFNALSGKVSHQSAHG